ncbi:MAG TPA: hypothetical protein VMH33_11935 [Solirubrobacterales bacterium]|nr:hypothetical protein [Solirubrobacterales bacterium]
MDESPPIACSLAGAELRNRYRDLGRFGAENLVSRSSDGDGEVLRFRRSAESEKGLRAIVAAEEECCPFLDFDLRERDGELVLRIAAGEDGRQVAAGLAGAFDQGLPA